MEQSSTPVQQMYFGKRIENFSIHWELRMRFITAFVWVFGIGVIKHHEVVLIGGTIFHIILRLLKIPRKKISKRILIIAPFLILSFITLLFSDGLPISRASISFAVLVSLRVIVCMFVVTLISLDHIQEYLNIFAAMHLPNALISTLFLTQRYVHMIGQQFTNIKKALVSRLFKPKMKVQTFKVYGQIVGGGMVRAIDCSNYVQNAMVSRGFTGKVWSAPAKPIRTLDIIKTILSILLLIGLVVIDQGVLA